MFCIPTRAKFFLIKESKKAKESTRRFPNVVMTMQTARLTAMKMVMNVPKGAGQHSGPHGVAAKVAEREKNN
jgi:hypothetical protein